MTTNSEDTNDLVVAFWRQARVMTYVAVPVLAVTVGIALGMPDIYQSTGVIRIEQSIDQNDQNLDTYAEYYVQTLTGQVVTPENLEAWVKEYGVYDYEPDWSTTRKVSELKDHLETSIVTTPVIDPKTGREHDVVTGFEISFNSHFPKESQVVSNAATDAFLKVNRQSRQERGQNEIDFFKQEAEKYRNQMSGVESRLADFKERNSQRLPELVQENKSAMDRVERDLESTQFQLQNLERERVILQSQLSQIPSTSDEAINRLAALQNEYVRLTSMYSDSHPDVISVRKQIELLSQTVDSSDAIPILQKQLEEMSTELANARKKYSDEHPEVRQLLRSESALKERIAALSAQPANKEPDVMSTNKLYVQVESQVKGIDAQIEGLQDRIQEQRQKRDKLEGLLLKTPQVEREYQDLMRDLSNVRKLYEETEAKLREAEMALALERTKKGERLILAQTPLVPSAPSWPPRLPILALGIILASGFAIGVAAVREMLNSTVRGARDVSDLFGAPPIAMIPTMLNKGGRMRRRVHTFGFLMCVVAVGYLSFLVAGLA